MYRSVHVIGLGRDVNLSPLSLNRKVPDLRLTSGNPESKLVPIGKLLLTAGASASSNKETASRLSGIRRCLSKRDYHRQAGHLYKALGLTFRSRE
jgi:hypothetical protein